MPHLTKNSPLPLAIAALLALAVPAQAETRTGYMAVDLDSGTVLAAQDGDRAFMPASILKVPTALAVLRELGPDHRFATRLMYSGTLRDGVIDGDLWLVGGGDPMLDTPTLARLTDALASAGIRGVRGRFLYDDTAIFLHEMIEDRQPPTASYNPGLAGLSLDFNRFKVMWKGGAPTGADIPLDPLPVALPVALTAPPTAQPGISEVWVPVRDPGRFTARVFQWQAAQRGIPLPLPEAAPVTVAATELARLDSPPLREILRRALVFSNNMATETVAIAATTKAGRPATLEDAATWLTRRTRDTLPDIDWTGFVMPNGSGLTEAARMTPAQCVALARRAAQDIPDLLPPLHLDPFGAVDHRTGSASPLRAKSGTIYYGRGLAGVIRANSGRQIAFCVMTDDHQERAKYDLVPFDERTDDLVRLPARRWLRAARETQERLILGWRDQF